MRNGKLKVIREPPTLQITSLTPLCHLEINKEISLLHFNQFEPPNEWQRNGEVSIPTYQDRH